MTQSNGKVLITGGAGFLGVNLCRYLLARGFDIRVLDTANIDCREKLEIEHLPGDVRSEEVCARALQGVDIVIHAAAAFSESPVRDIFSIGVGGTRVLLEQARRTGIARLIFISTTEVYGAPRSLPSHEDDPLSKMGAYGAAKIEAEKLCLAYRAGGACTTILRPKTFIGPERLGIWEILYDFAYDGHHFPVIGGDKPHQLLDVEDFCHAIYLCMTHGTSKVNDTFNVGAARFGTLKENFQAVLDRAGYRKRVIDIPTLPTVLTLRLLECLKLSPIHRWSYETAANGSVDSIERIQRTLGFQPKYSNADALIRNYDWYVEHRSEIVGRTGTSHRTPWKRGVLHFAKLAL